MISNILQKILVETKDNQSVMADKLGIDSGRLSKIISRKTTSPRVDFIKRICQAYKIDPYRLYELVMGEPYHMPKLQQTKLELDLEEAKCEIESLKEQLKNERTEKERWWQTARDALQRIPEHTIHKTQHPNQRGESSGAGTRAGKPVGSPDP